MAPRRAGSTPAPVDFAELCKFLLDLDRWLASTSRDLAKVHGSLCNVERKSWGEPARRSKRLCAPVRPLGVSPADPGTRAGAAFPEDLNARLAELDAVLRARDRA